MEDWIVVDWERKESDMEKDHWNEIGELCLVKAGDLLKKETASALVTAETVSVIERLIAIAQVIEKEKPNQDIVHPVDGLEDAIVKSMNSGALRGLYQRTTTLEYRQTEYPIVVKPLLEEIRKKLIIHSILHGFEILFITLIVLFHVFL
jgi:hypothetical protein